MLKLFGLPTIYTLLQNPEMLENFQLTALVKTGGNARLLHIPLHQKLQNSLAQNWQEQYEVFIKDVQEVDFDAGYNPEEHERFRLRDFELPDWLSNEDSQTVSQLDSISVHEDEMDSIKSIVAFAKDDGEELMLFQNFTRSHVIRPGHFLFLRNDTYETAQHRGLTLDCKLSAVCSPSENKLLFHNFRTVNSFLPLSDYYEEASEQQIREVLQHELLAAEDADALAVGSNQWFRKRFAMLRDSGLLDQYSASQIRRRSHGYDVDIKVSNGQIVFPADKPAAKKLLQFLNEEIFRGAITETLYETNSKREAD